MDPIKLRLKNLLKNGDQLVTGAIFNGENPTKTMIETLIASASYEQRKLAIEDFNRVGVTKKEKR